VPGLEDVLKLRAPGLLGCALSGAGPSIIVFYERGSEQVCGLVQQIFAIHGHGSEILLTQVAEHGFSVE
ncbi:MAG: homoserine kinase, partial [Bryobacteraceae bacterium]